MIKAKSGCDEHMSEREKELLARIERLEAQQAKINPPATPFAAPPQRRFDPTEGMGMPAAAMAEMVTVGDRVLAGIVADGRRTSAPSSIAVQPAPAARPAVGRNGWVDAVPLRNGFDPLIEAQLDAQDARDRRELERKLGGGR